jgi:hypothetical protein
MRGKVAPMPLPPKLNHLAGMALLLAVVVACQPKIGDKCSTGTDCSQTGGRACDTTMPGGYCTMPNCEPDGCPEEAACIAFALSPSTLSLCKSANESRGLRAFCMRRCSSQDDCRAGYACLDLNAPNNLWGAERIDKSSADGRVCALEYSATPAVELASDSGTRADYCTASRYDADAGPGYATVAAGGATWANQASAGNASTAGNAGTDAGAGAAGNTGTDAGAGATAGGRASDGSAGNAGSGGLVGGQSGASGSGS